MLENPSLWERIRTFPQYLIPQHLLSGWMYSLARCQWQPFKNLAIRIFVYLYRVDMELAVQSDYRQYKHFNLFFTRELNPDSRPVNNNNLICSPVDGTVSQVGEIRNDELVQAKGHYFKLQDLLGKNGPMYEKFDNGSFVTLYLSPRDYHRIHMPVSGVLQEMIYIPGKLFSVNQATTRCVPGLFARNERLINLFQTDYGLMAVILIGAIFVGSMETVWAGQITPAKRRQITQWSYSDTEQVIQLKKGDELGRFNMGSTVIMLFEPGKIEWFEELQPNDVVIMGRDIAKPVAISDKL